jgi:hypothetical protein
VFPVETWGASSFENDTASDWFHLLEEALAEAGEEGAWFEEVDDLIARLERSGAGDPATLSP